MVEEDILVTDVKADFVIDKEIVFEDDLMITSSL